MGTLITANRHSSKKQEELNGRAFLACLTGISNGEKCLKSAIQSKTSNQKCRSALSGLVQMSGDQCSPLSSIHFSFGKIHFSFGNEFATSETLLSASHFRVCIFCDYTDLPVAASVAEMVYQWPEIAGFVRTDLKVPSDTLILIESNA